MKLFLVRHGQTDANLERICQYPGSVLTDLGWEQARKVAERLQDETIDLVFSSPFERAVKTAEEIIKYHSKLNIKIEPRIVERDFGIFSGKPYPADFSFDNLPDGIETDKELCARVRSFVAEVKTLCEEKNVLIVFHEGIMRAFLTVLLDKDCSEMNKLDSLATASVTEIEITNGVCQEISFGCDKHL